MEKKKRTKRVLLYCIPLFIQLIVHIIGSFIAQRGGDNYLWRVVAATIVTGFSMVLGEGHSAVAFFIAGFYDRIGVYVATIVLSITSAIVSFIGYTIAGMEIQPCLWMTFVFWIIDLFLFVFSIVRINQLISKKYRK